MVSPSDDHRRRKRRHLRRVSPPALVGAALFGLIVTAVSAPASDAVVFDVSTTGPTGLAVAGLTSNDPVTAAAAAIPRDFAAYSGYEPVLRHGVLVAPDGDCSSPVELPREFDTACMAHDLGYDLLRYADSVGAPLGPWARQELDRTLAVRLHQACDAHAEPMVRTRCETFASVAATAVELNSRRQHYGVPVVETFTQAATQAATDHPTQPWLLRLVALVVTAGAGLVLGIRRLHRRVRRPAVTAPGAHRGVPAHPGHVLAAARIARRRSWSRAVRPAVDSVPLPKLPLFTGTEKSSGGATG